MIVLPYVYVLYVGGTRYPQRRLCACCFRWKVWVGGVLFFQLFWIFLNLKLLSLNDLLVLPYIYRTLHKYRITSRRSIRRRAFSKLVYRVAKIEKMT
jgi:hypothetical protein